MFSLKFNINLKLKTKFKRGATMVKDKVETKVKETRLSGGLYWLPSIGDEIIGKLVAVRKGNYDHEIYDIETDEGVKTIPASAVLEGIFSKDKVKDLLDKKFRFRFLGWGKDRLPDKKPGLYRNFDVFLIEEG